jgi:threonylcarbamoyladenosine tRNA methylthiotransferase MtaB
MVKTLGCKVNQCDTQRLVKRLIAAGFDLDDSKPEIVFVNTCAVTKTATAKSRRTFNRLRRSHPEAKLVIMGCWPKLDKEIKNVVKADYIWGIGNYEKLFKVLTSEKQAKNKQGRNIKKFNNHSRYFLKVQDGCNQYCSYCVVPYARGREISYQEKKIINEAAEAIKSGFGEIVVTGTHLGRYGRDTGTSLNRLLKKLALLPGLGRIRLSSIEATEIDRDIIDLIKSSGKICAHFHLPLQSGSDKILRAMNRPYSQNEFMEKVELIRSNIPQAAITTDIIVGFPGESTDDFIKTKELIKKLKFSRLHVFKYSENKATKAVKMPDKTDDLIKNDRAEELRNLGEQLKKEYLARFNNKNLELLVERSIGSEFIGKSEYYFDIRFSKEQITGRTNIHTNNSLIGSLVSINN